LFSPCIQLLKFHWFLWGYYYFKDTNRFNDFESVILPDKLIEYNIAGYETFRNIKYSYHIWSDSVIYHLSKEIKYFASINKISSDSLTLIKNELHQVLDFLERTSVDGNINQTGNKFEFYSTTLNIDKTATYMLSEKMSLFKMPMFCIHRICSQERELCNTAQRWIKSIRNASVLISESAEKERVLFLKKNRELVESI